MSDTKCRCGCGRASTRFRGRGLNSSCYYRASRDGTLADYPRVTHDGADVVAEVEHVLAARGVEGAMSALGMSAAAVARACHRHGRPDLARQFDRIASRERWARQRAGRERSHA